MRKFKQQDNPTTENHQTDFSDNKQNNGILTWSYETKRVKSKIIDDSLVLINKLGETNPKELKLMTDTINLHNEYRFPLQQLIDVNKKNVDIAYQFLIFLCQTKK